MTGAHPRHVVRPGSVAEVVAVLAEHPDIPVFAGGTLAVPDWRYRGAPEVVMHLGGVAEVRDVRHGALTTLAELVEDDQAPRALRQAAASIGGPAVRAMATVGGNAVAARPGCVATALLAVGAVAHLLPRHTPWEETTAGIEDVFLTQNTVLLATPWETSHEQRSAFAKVAVRAAGGPNVVSVAVCRDAAACAVAVGAPGSLPRRLTLSESRWRDGACAVEVAAAAADEVVLVDDITASARYRRSAVGTLVRRLVTELEEPR